MITKRAALFVTSDRMERRAFPGNFSAPTVSWAPLQAQRTVGATAIITLRVGSWQTVYKGCPEQEPVEAGDVTNELPLCDKGQLRLKE